MRPTKYVVKLSVEERQNLETMLRKGKHSAREMRRARVLLLADQQKSNKQIIEETGMCEQSIITIKQKYLEQGIALKDKPRPGQKPKLDKRQESYLVALACSPAPKGRDVWTMQLLADKLVEMEVVDSISDETVRRKLKKMNLNPGKASNGV